jgi:PilZ domain
MTDQPKDRRLFSRIHFDAWAELRQGERHWHAAVLDLSLKGLLVREPEGWQLDVDQPVRAAIQLANQATIQMTVRLRHSGNGQIGFECEFIDLDSISNLRRLVELNLGDPELLERQLGALGGQGR